MPRSRPVLSRREREIMEIVYRRGSATAADVMKDLADPPSYSAVRATMRILEEKGHLRHQVEATRYLYLPTVSPERAQRAALKDLVRTFFRGSPKAAVLALLDEAADLPPGERTEIKRLIEDARKEGR
jgi:BlaI family transcriptional regulator, penicillinase repressor